MTNSYRSNFLWLEVLKVHYCIFLLILYNFDKQVPELIEGKEYEFRIIAVNNIGESPASKPSAMVLVEEQPGKSDIHIKS